MEIKLLSIGGPTWILEFEDLKIGADPQLSEIDYDINLGNDKIKRVSSPLYSNSEISNIDLWLFTKNSPDFIDEKGLSFVETDSMKILTKYHSSYLTKKKFENGIILNSMEHKILNINGWRISIGSIPVKKCAKKTFSSLLADSSQGYIVELQKADHFFSFYITGYGIVDAETINSLAIKRFDFVLVHSGAYSHKKIPLKLAGRVLNGKNELLEAAENLICKRIIPIYWDAYSHTEEQYNEYSFLGNKSIRLLEPGGEILINDNPRNKRDLYFAD